MPASRTHTNSFTQGVVAPETEKAKARDLKTTELEFITVEDDDDDDDDDEDEDDDDDDDDGGEDTQVSIRYANVCRQ